MPKTTAIIFSKNRTLQLKSLLLSIRHYSDVPENIITVIYKADEGISYEPLKNEFKANFIEQKNFLEDLKKTVERSDSEYIWFMVDDLIFREQFYLSDIEKFLSKNPDIDSFCLRLGKNITEKGNQPDFTQIENGMLTWNTDSSQGKHWNYFWELSSSIYRRNLVLDYLSKCRPNKEKFPNPLEYHYYACMPNTRTRGLIGIYLLLRYPFGKRSTKVACFEKSKCFTHGINLVANIDDQNRKNTYTPQELHKKMLEGYVVDFISPVEINSPNPGNKFFKLIKND